MDKERKRELRRIAVGAVLLIVAMAAERIATLPLWAVLLLYLPGYLVAGADVLAEAAEGLWHGEWLGEECLMSVATLGALAVGFLPGGEPAFPEAVLVLLLFRVGEWMEQAAQEKSRRSVAHLMGLRPDRARVERDGQVVETEPEQVVPGDILQLRPGDKVPVDGVVLEGRSALDTTALTGESVPRTVEPGDAVLSGCINRSGVLRMRATKAYGTSTAARILQLVEQAGERRSARENFIARFARVYTPAVVGAAAVAALVPPLFGGVFAVWLRRALTFLIVSCPCALVISVPLTFFCGIGAASRRGVLIKGSRYLEALARPDTVVFDKTGTLTHGEFAVQAVHAQQPAEPLLHLAAHAERCSTHPIALSLRQAYAHEADGCTVRDVTEAAGQGVSAMINGRRVCVGNERMMQAVGAEWKPCHRGGAVIHVAVDGVYAGHIVISDRIKTDAADALRALRRLGVRRTVMLTGDRAAAAAPVADALPLDEWHADLLPEQKAEWVRRLRDGLPAGGTVVFVGDGINDAPVLLEADLGVAMGALGSDAAMEAADVVLMRDALTDLAGAVAIARRTVRLARENIVLSLAIKAAVLVLVACGWAPMWLAVLADVGVTVLAVGNALRAMR